MKVRLKEISHLKYGKMPDKRKVSAKGYPIFTGYKISGFYPEYMYDKSVIIVVARGVGGTGDVKLAPARSFITNLSIIVDIIESKIVNKKYLQLLLNSMNLRSLDSGSAQSQITITALSNVEIDLPSKKIQNQIANKINLLERKIELNNQINANLVELAKIIFEKMDNATKYIPISKLVEVKDGTHDSPKQRSIGYPLVTSKAIKGMSIDFSQLKLISKQDFNKINERSLVEHGDILFSMIGTVGLVYKVIENPVNYAIKNVGLIKTHESIYSTLIYLSLISSRGHEYVKSHMSGSTQQFLSLTNLRKFPIPDISKGQLHRLNYLLNPIFNEIENLAHQNSALNKAKNRLLSKLLN